MAEQVIELASGSGRAIDRVHKFGRMKIRVDASADETTRKIARAYGRAWQIVKGEAETMATFAAEMNHRGVALSPREISNLDRVTRSQFALERQLREVNKFAGLRITGVASERYREDVDTLLDTLSEISGVDRRFTRPSGRALEGMVLRSTERIESSVRRLDAYQSRAMKDALLRGLVYGDNPHDTANRIMRLTEGAFLGGRYRAATIARTEIADANRYATRLAFNESEAVVGWKWLASISPRTCPACWAMHGTFHEKDEPQYAHANCRCTMVPVLADDLPEDHDLGNPEEIFWNLPREDQLAIMGPGRLKALEGGAPWSSLAHLRPSTDWRPAYTATSVTDLQGLADLQVASFPGDVITIPGQTNASVMGQAYRSGGMTIHALTGQQPTSGYVVARSGTSLVIDAREFFGPKGPTELAAYLRRHGDRLDADGAHLGLWYDTENGKVVLDVVEILDDRDAAIALGRAEDQIAIFDLNTFTEIQTGGSGGYTDISSALGQADIGRTATIVRNGESYTGTVIAAGDWGVRVRDGDGNEWNGAADQVTFGDSARPTMLDQIKEVERIEAEGKARHGIPVSYAYADPKVARDADDALHEVTSAWPRVKPDEVYTKQDGEDGAFAVTETSFDPVRRPDGSFESNAESDIYLNRHFASDFRRFQDTMATAEITGHFHEGTSDDPADYAMEHEFGHVLAHALLDHPRTPQGQIQRIRIIRDGLNALYHDQQRREERELGWPKGSRKIDEHDVITRWGVDSKWIEDVTDDLSGYGSVDPGELIAEGFAIYRDHGPGKSRFADTVMGHLVNKYVEKFGEAPEEDGLDQLVEILEEWNG